MNQFMWGLGVPENVGFCDVYGLDDEMLAMVPQPVLGVILLYPQDRSRNPRLRLPHRWRLRSPARMYISQGRPLETLGIIHALGNARIKLGQGLSN